MRSRLPAAPMAPGPHPTTPPGGAPYTCAVTPQTIALAVAGLAVGAILLVLAGSRRRGARLRLEISRRDAEAAAIGRIAAETGRRLATASAGEREAAWTSRILTRSVQRARESGDDLRREAGRRASDAAATEALVDELRDELRRLGSDQIGRASCRERVYVLV